ncbi:nucleoside phosphorylase [Actinopolymorpha alba]|uniref:nucleoside phosphorylase n=1 Tax=Actinopolymorpha alba TaxID=533267 RepID=UPI00037963A2|nr:nucleoside phosphorylase [Actinopolymorpha alba]
MPAQPAWSKQHHLQIGPGDVGRYAFLPGDPGRCERIAARFDDPRHVATNREYTTWSGTLDGEPVSVTSTGIGCPSTAIAVEELVRAGADTFVRVGTGGGMQPDTAPGDVAVVTAAIRDEGTSSHYLPIEFPAVADPDVTWALAEGARSSGANVRLGVAQTKDSFFGQHEPARMPVADRLLSRWKAWVDGGAICSEMEAAGLFVVSSVLRVRAGAVVLIAGHHDRAPLTDEEKAACELDGVIDAAVAGMRRLIALDRMRPGVNVDSSSSAGAVT